MVTGRMRGPTGNSFSGRFRIQNKDGVLGTEAVRKRDRSCNEGEYENGDKTADYAVRCAGIPRGVELVNRHELNKGTAFTDEERSNFGLFAKPVARALAPYDTTRWRLY